jgi:hypothetical protein
MADRGRETHAVAARPDNLAYLEKRRKVTKDVGETGVVWALA